MTNSTESPSLDNTAWVLSTLAGRAPVAAQPTARFEGGRVQGTDGCNRYNAPYSTNGSAIEVGTRGATTQMACSPEVMKQAGAFMAAMTGAKTYRVSAAELQLLAADGIVLASFAAQSQSLAGTSWRATGINNGKGAVASLVADSKVTMNFAADGKVSGSAGCNNYTASYQADGGKLRFTPAAATRRMCGAPGVMEQERAFLKALESVATMRMEADRLELRTAENALAAILVRAPAP
jgi:heat shock protein HslJ